MPVMVCIGQRDPVFCAAELMAAELPEARYVQFRESGHGLPARSPRAFSEELGRFLEDVETEARVAGRRTINPR
jgi:pimeloyl-ACP methyl ester carboxylesterase